jgi:hypothetical protein
VRRPTLTALEVRAAYLSATGALAADTRGNTSICVALDKVIIESWSGTRTPFVRTLRSARRPSQRLLERLKTPADGRGAARMRISRPD